MLHPVPDSIFRGRMLAVVKLQRHLMGRLCALPTGATVNLRWLQRVWRSVPADWVRRFWENGKGERAGWMATIAAASTSDKRAIGTLVSQQLRFAQLYSDPPAIQLTNQSWKSPVFLAVSELLIAFYDPLFYESEGFELANGTRFHKGRFLNPRPKICPYSDNFVQDTKLDHFLPKDSFPVLSCHPDNLIPCSTDPNSVGRKGKTVPLDLTSPNQAEEWFHPRWRTAKGRYKLAFGASAKATQPEVHFVAIDPWDQPRLSNMAQMFGLSEFWGGVLDDEVQNVASDVTGMLRFDSKEPTEENVKDRVQLRAHQERNRIGKDGLAIAKSFYYEHIAHTPTLLDQVVRICQKGT